MGELTPTITVIIAAVGVAGGLSGLAALYSAITNSPKTAKRTEVETLTLTVNALAATVGAVQQDNALLRERIRDLESGILKMQKTIAKYLSGINKLARQIEATGLEPVWVPDHPLGDE